MFNFSIVTKNILKGFNLNEGRPKCKVLTVLGFFPGLLHVITIFLYSVSFSLNVY